MFLWTTAQEASFQALKTTLITALVLALPDLHKPFVIKTDVSDKGISAMLQQEDNLIDYVSKTLGPKNQAWSTYEKVCLAILLVVDHLRTYLQKVNFLSRLTKEVWYI